jgi:voltage-gated potassium channel Kch
MEPERPRLIRFATHVTILRAIGLIIVVFALFTLLAAFVEWLVEPQTFKTFGDACWWSIQTVSTVGYGDDVPETAAGRIVATLVMLFGMAFVPAVTSIIVAILVERGRRGLARDAIQRSHPEE